MAISKSSGYSNLPSGNWLPVIYSQKVQKFFRTASVVEAITNTDYAGEIENFGDTVNIIKEPTITVQAYTRGATINTQDIADDQLQLIVDQANSFAFKVDDIEESTSGIPKMIRKLANENPKFQLALSLHSAREEVRNQIMPFSNRFPLDELLTSLQYWYSMTKSRITLEYLIWKDVNDTPEDIKALITYAKKVPCKVNIIEYNPIGDDQFQAASSEIIRAYEKALTAARITVTVRRSRGKDIDAACGQLANKLIPLTKE
jgi:hypothetical protein